MKKKSIVVVHGEDFVNGVFVRIDVNHPAKDDGMEAAADRVTGFLGGDEASQTEFERSVRLPETGYRERAALMVFLKFDSRLDDLRSEPRFKDLLRRMNFPS